MPTGDRRAGTGGALFDVVIDAIGGPSSGRPYSACDPGDVVNFASTVTEPVSFPTRELFGRAPGPRLRALHLRRTPHTRSGSADLRRLADLIAVGRLDPQVDMVSSWTKAGEAITALLERRVAGKAVLTVD